MHNIGDIITVEITAITSYGAFTKTEDGTDGLIHISEITNKFIRDINEYLSVGEKVKAKVIGFQDKNGYLKLSLKDINYREDPDWEDPHSFDTLRKNLPKWVEEKLNEYK